MLSQLSSAVDTALAAADAAEDCTVIVKSDYFIAFVNPEVDHGSRERSAREAKAADLQQVTVHLAVAAWRRNVVVVHDCAPEVRPFCKEDVVSNSGFDCTIAYLTT